MDSTLQPILIVEDSAVDYMAANRAFRKSGLANPILRARDGDEALDYLYRRGAYAGSEEARTPGLVILDLNLPGTDGREVLALMKADPNLRTIPVVIMTTSDDERDIGDCYAMGANTYLQKPVDLGGLLTAIQRLGDYWFGIAILPRCADDVPGERDSDRGVA